MSYSYGVDPKAKVPAARKFTSQPKFEEICAKKSPNHLRIGRLVSINLEIVCAHINYEKNNGLNNGKT